MTDEEKLHVINEINRYIHEIANHTTAINCYTRNNILCPIKIKAIKESARKIELEGIKIRLNLINIFIEEDDMKGDENGST